MILTKGFVWHDRLVNAFVISVKHHLRGESGTDYQDYFGADLECPLRSIGDN